MNSFSLQFDRETENRDTFDKTEAECSDGIQQEAENIQKEVLIPSRVHLILSSTSRISM